MDRLLYSPTAIVIIILVLIIGTFIYTSGLTPHRIALPPGPKEFPLLGSAFEINTSEPWLTYREWHNAYGEIVSCKLLGQHFIILNSERVARALLEQRSTIYSDRPVIRTASLFGMDFTTAHISYGNTWRAHRKIFHQTLNSSIIAKYHQSVARKARGLLENLLRAPDNFVDHTRTFAASVIMSITYGYDVLPRDDPFVAPLEELIRIVVLMTPERAILLNTFPQLVHIPSWIPGAELQRLATRCKQLSPKVRDEPYKFVQNCLAKGIDNESMVAQLLKDEVMKSQDQASYEQYIKDCATSSFIAGTDTTHSTLTTLIMAMILYPEVQARAHEELDRVVGRDRLPAFDDRVCLPYIDAILRETSRWGSLVPMAIPHMSNKDDVFELQYIPKGAIIILNLWGMSQDEERFPEPSIFRPERHLDANGNLLSEDISGLFFGYGRRACPGRYLANTSTWFAAASMIHMFNFNKAIGLAGYEIDIFPKFTGGVALRPAPFPARITPRLDNAQELID